MVVPTTNPATWESPTVLVLIIVAVIGAVASIVVALINKSKKKPDEAASPPMQQSEPTATGDRNVTANSSRNITGDHSGNTYNYYISGAVGVNPPQSTSIDEANSEYLLATQFFQQGDFTKAIEHYEAAISTMEEKRKKLDIEIAKMLGALGNSYAELSQFDKASDAYIRSLDLYKRAKE